jgi:Patatin-like phospholipase
VTAQPKTIALVLAGAVAQGAFEVGVIRALARADVDIVRIVASSSGALNGTVFAAGLRARDPIDGAETLARLWRDHADWNEVFHLSVRDLLRRDGLSDQTRLLELLREHVPPSDPDDPAPINLRLIVAALAGPAAASSTSFRFARSPRCPAMRSPGSSTATCAASTSTSATPAASRCSAGWAGRIDPSAPRRAATTSRPAPRARRAGSTSAPTDRLVHVSGAMGKSRTPTCLSAPR